MTSDLLLTLFRFFHNEEECPFEPQTTDAMWWSGEKMIYDQTKNDPYFFGRIRQRFEDAFKEGHCNGALADESLSLDQRTIIFYLDMWHGKWFPYDDCSIIKTYLKTPLTPL